MAKIDNITGKNKEAFRKLSEAKRNLEDRNDILKLNRIFKEIIEEECPVRAFPADGKYSRDFVQLKTAEEKQQFMIKLLEEATKEISIRIKNLHYDEDSYGNIFYCGSYTYSSEIQENKESLKYYETLKEILK